MRKLNIPSPGVLIQPLNLTGSRLKAHQYNIRHPPRLPRRLAATVGRKHVDQLQELELSATPCHEHAETETLEHDSIGIVGGQLGIRCWETMDLEAS
jgi:hypothetical protein